MANSQQYHWVEGSRDLSGRFSLDEAKQMPKFLGKNNRFLKVVGDEGKLVKTFSTKVLTPYTF